MFVLNHANGLFRDKYALKQDENRGGYWAIYRRLISYIPESPYEFGWPEISDEEFKERFPKHYKNYLYHAKVLNI